MKVFLVTAILAASVAAQTCPANGTSASAVATAPAIKPENVPNGCAAFEILVARGTGEYDRKPTNGQPIGKFGVVVGDPLVDQVIKSVPSARGYPVQYPASMAPNSPSLGAADVNSRLNKLSKECPDMKFAIVGYSQGAAVMHAASASFAPAVKSKILASVMFGDPTHKTGTGYFQGIKSMNVCNAGNSNILPDPVCDPSLKSLLSFCFDAHVHYYEEQFMKPAIEFVVKAFKGLPIQDKLITGNDPWKADPSISGAGAGKVGKLLKV